jgi:hypothetical protein
VSALPAADFAALDADPERRVRAAAEAALELVAFDVRLCASALPAADLAAFDAPPLRSVLDAALAAALPVFSDLAITTSLVVVKRTVATAEGNERLEPGLADLDLVTADPKSDDCTWVEPGGWLTFGSVTRRSTPTRTAPIASSQVRASARSPPPAGAGRTSTLCVEEV